MSEAINIVAVVQGKAGTADKLYQIIKPCVAASRNDTGCLQYQIHRDLDHADRFVFLERWASRQSLQHHEQTAHFKTFAETIKPLLADPLSVFVLSGSLEGPQL